MGKRVFDVGASLVLLLLSSPAWIVISLYLIFFGQDWFVYQERLGQSGKSFLITKFPTLRNGAVSGDEDDLVRDDPRITRLGRFLRPLRLDELPQLVNILRGDMSLVGPRPLPPRIHYARLEKMPAYAERLAALPGLTGLAQITTLPQGTDTLFRQLSLDLHYIQHRSLGLDLKIIIRTILVVLRREAF